MTNEPKDIEETLDLGRGGGSRWRLILLLILVLAVGAWLFARHSRQKEESGPTYETAQAVRGDLVVTVTATGQLEPVNTVLVGTEVSGTVASVEVDYNDRVTKGQVLARLDTARLSAQVAQSRAALELAQANLAQARAQALVARQRLDRLREVRRLSGGKAPAESDIEQQEATLGAAEASVEAARAAVDQARASLSLDETNLSKATVFSPINGVVLERAVEPGQTVAASLQAPVLFQIAEDLARMELHVDVDEADVGQVREGQNATFTVDAYPGDTFEALVTQVRYAATTDAGVVTYDTLLSVDNDDLALRPGMTATADIKVQEIKDAVLVPNRALRFRPPAEKPEEKKDLMTRIFPWRRPRPVKRPPAQGPGEEGTLTVWVKKDGLPSPVRIKAGATNGDMTQVLSGDVKAGTDLIVEEVKKPS